MIQHSRHWDFKFCGLQEKCFKGGLGRGMGSASDSDQVASRRGGQACLARPAENPTISDGYSRYTGFSTKVFKSHFKLFFYHDSAGVLAGSSQSLCRLHTIQPLGDHLIHLWPAGSEHFPQYLLGRLKLTVAERCWSFRG